MLHGERACGKICLERSTARERGGDKARFSYIAKDVTGLDRVDVARLAQDREAWRNHCEGATVPIVVVEANIGAALPKS